MKKDQSVYIEQMLICINRIENYTKKASYEDFVKNEMMHDAIVLQLGIIGETSSKISEEIKLKYNHISWIDIKGMRNKIFHDYFGVNFEVIWYTLKINIPELKKSC